MRDPYDKVNDGGSRSVISLRVELNARLEKEHGVEISTSYGFWEVAVIVTGASTARLSLSPGMARFMSNDQYLEQILPVIQQAKNS